MVIDLMVDTRFFAKGMLPALATARHEKIINGNTDSGT
jgi:hypothetical protein